MRYYNRITLKEGTHCVIRSTDPADAAALIDSMKRHAGESNNLLRYPDEIDTTIEGEREYIISMQENSRAVSLVAEIDGAIVGNAGLSPVMSFSRVRHRATLGLAVDADCWGRGIGSALLAACIKAAHTMKYEQIELDVLTDNSAAIALYEKFGFTSYGVLEHAFRMRGGAYGALRQMCLYLK